MTSTVGILSILEGPVLNEARRLWKCFETDYGSSGVQCFDYPNVTFQAGYCQNIQPLGEALSQLSQQLRPFELIIDGWSCFESSNVFYLQVQPTEALRQIHREVNWLFEHHGVDVFGYYLPEQWVPHVTVAMEDLTAANLARAKRDLRGYHPRYRQMIANINLVERCNESGRIEIIRSFPNNTKPRNQRAMAPNP